MKGQKNNESPFYLLFPSATFLDHDISTREGLGLVQWWSADCLGNAGLARAVQYECGQARSHSTTDVGRVRRGEEGGRGGGERRGGEEGGRGGGERRGQEGRGEEGRGEGVICIYMYMYNNYTQCKSFFLEIQNIS